MKYSVLFSMIICLLFSVEFLTCQEDYSSEYKIGPKDLLEISVVDMDELNRTVRVSEEGTITLPHLGEIEVDGLTKVELENKLKELLGQGYLVNPQVNIFIREYQSKRVLVMGAVGSPGPYELLGRQTVRDIISQAGGFTGDAGNELIVIRQNEDGTSSSLSISLEDLFLKGDFSLNVPLQPNDIINIPPDELVKIYIGGQVRNPGMIEVKKSNVPTLLQAIIQAGGFAERASKGKVILKRKDETGKETTRRINVKDIISGKKKDIPLLPNDVIFVPETMF